MPPSSKSWMPTMPTHAFSGLSRKAMGLTRESDNRRMSGLSNSR